MSKLNESIDSDLSFLDHLNPFPYSTRQLMQECNLTLFPKPYEYEESYISPSEEYSDSCKSDSDDHAVLLPNLSSPVRLYEVYKTPDVTYKRSYSVDIEDFKINNDTICPIHGNTGSVSGTDDDVPAGAYGISTNKVKRNIDLQEYLSQLDKEFHEMKIEHINPSFFSHGQINPSTKNAEDNISIMSNLSPRSPKNKDAKILATKGKSNYSKTSASDEEISQSEKCLKPVSYLSDASGSDCAKENSVSDNTWSKSNSEAKSELKLREQGARKKTRKSDHKDEVSPKFKGGNLELISPDIAKNSRKYGFPISPFKHTKYLDKNGMAVSPPYVYGCMALKYQYRPEVKAQIDSALDRKTHEPIFKKLEANHPEEVKAVFRKLHTTFPRPRCPICSPTREKEESSPSKRMTSAGYKVPFLSSEQQAALDSAIADEPARTLQATPKSKRKLNLEIVPTAQEMTEHENLKEEEYEIV